MRERVKIVYQDVGNIVEIHWVDKILNETYVVKYTAPPTETRKVLKKLKDRSE